MSKNSFIILLVCLNIYLLYSNIRKNSELNNFTATTNRTLFSDLGSNIFINNPSVLPDSSDISLLTIITPQSCIVCVKEEVKYLNKIWNENNSRLSVLYIGNAKDDILKQFDVAFEYQILKNQSKLFSKDFEFKNPTSFLILDKKLIYDIHESEFGNPKKSQLFFQKVNMLFEFIKSAD